jgi:hypothetical protein
MKTEQVKQVTDKALGQLITALERGQSATLTRYLAGMARFHRYSFNNVMLIYTQREDASHVAGFHTWRKLGRFVRKGEKGILILAPMIFKRAEAEAAKTDDEKTIVRFKQSPGLRGKGQTMKSTCRTSTMGQSARVQIAALTKDDRLVAAVLRLSANVTANFTANHIITVFLIHGIGSRCCSKGERRRKVGSRGSRYFQRNSGRSPEFEGEIKRSLMYASPPELAIPLRV